MLDNIYLICLIVGALYSVLSLVLNGVLDSFDFDFDFEFGDLALPVKPFTIMVFVTVFGGVGLLSLRWMPPWITLIPAVLAGSLVSFGLYRLFYVRLRRYETTAPTEDDALMRRAEVVETILPGGYGKISYVVDGNTLSGAAKEIKPGPGVAKGRKVYILEIRENVYYVCEDPEIHLTSR